MPIDSRIIVVLTILTLTVLALVAWWVWLQYRRVRSTPPLLRGEKITVDGHEIFYVRAGSGPTLILLHGIGASVFTWRLVMPMLASRFDVIAVDLLGFGESAKPWQANLGLEQQAKVLLGLTEKLKVSRAIWAGSSMGGAIAFWLAAFHPQLVKGVIAIAPAVNPKLVPVPVSWLRWTAPLFVTSVNRWTMRIILRSVLANRENIDAETVEAYLRPYRWNYKTIASFLSATEAIGDQRLPEAFPRIKVPVLLMHGSVDRMVPSENTRHLLDLIPDAEYIELVGAGHHPQEDLPQQVAEKIGVFARTRIQPD